MRVLSSADFLDLWERGSRLHPLDRALLALSAALPEAASDDLADWPLGRRNRALVELHCACFGSSLHGWNSCTGCGEKMEFEMDSRALLREKVDEQRPGETVVFKGQPFRLPSSRDLALVANETDPRAAALRVIESCRVEAEASTAISDDDVEQVGEQMALADPLAEIRLSLRCPVCGHESDESLDISSFVWAEIEARARRLLWEVHTFASAYGWTEPEVLSLSAARRARYLEMVQA